MFKKAVRNPNSKEKQNISPVEGGMVTLGSKSETYLVTLGSKSETYFDTTFLKTSVFRRPVWPPLLQKYRVVWRTRLFAGFVLGVSSHP